MHSKMSRINDDNNGLYGYIYRVMRRYCGKCMIAKWMHDPTTPGIKQGETDNNFETLCCCVTPTLLVVHSSSLYSMETLQDVFQGAASVDINQVEYSVYLPCKQDPKAMMEFVQETLAMIRSIVQPFTDKYLWQKDQFHLAIVQESGMKSVVHGLIP